MDYEQLLRKFLQHVTEEEGCDFVYYYDRGASSRFTPEEWAELKRVAREARDTLP